jgi:acylphosphatase
MKKAVRVSIFGTVQSVFFRQFILESAEKTGVKGYVRNKADGSVEAWFEGEDLNVKKMIELARQGPKHAVINKVDIKDENFQGMKEFKILNI